MKSPSLLRSDAQFRHLSSTLLQLHPTSSNFFQLHPTLSNLIQLRPTTAALVLLAHPSSLARPCWFARYNSKSTALPLPYMCKKEQPFICGCFLLLPSIQSIDTNPHSLAHSYPLIAPLYLNIPTSWSVGSLFEI